MQFNNGPAEPVSLGLLVISHRGPLPLQVVRSRDGVRTAAGTGWEKAYVQVFVSWFILSVI